MTVPAKQWDSPRPQTTAHRTSQSITGVHREVTQESSVQFHFQFSSIKAATLSPQFRRTLSGQSESEPEVTNQLATYVSILSFNFIQDRTELR